MIPPWMTRRKAVQIGVSVITAGLAGCVTDGSTATDAASTEGVVASPSESTELASNGTTQSDSSSTTMSNTVSTTGLRLPSISAPGSPGGPITVQPPRKVILLDFFATWCQPCIPEMKNLRAVRAAYSHEDVFVISLTQETDRIAIKRFWERYNGTWPVAMDPNLEATQAHVITSLPTVVVLAADGTRVMRDTGLVGEEPLVAAIESALEQGPN